MVQASVQGAVQDAVQQVMDDTRVKFDVRANFYTLIAITGVVIFWWVTARPAVELDNMQAIAHMTNSSERCDSEGRLSCCRAEVAAEQMICHRAGVVSGPRGTIFLALQFGASWALWPQAWPS